MSERSVRVVRTSLLWLFHIFHSYLLFIIFIYNVWQSLSHDISHLGCKTVEATIPKVTFALSFNGRPETFSKQLDNGLCWFSSFSSVCVCVGEIWRECATLSRFSLALCVCVLSGIELAERLISAKFGHKKLEDVLKSPADAVDQTTDTWVCVCVCLCWSTKSH